MTLSQSVFVNAKPVESCSENVSDWLSSLPQKGELLALELLLALTKYIDIDHGDQGVHMSMMRMPAYKHKCTIKTGRV